MLGEELNGYIIEGMIGQGAFADVYVGRHQTLCNQRALKVLIRREPHLRERFRHEARMLASVSHPAVPRCIDLTSTKAGQLVLVMEMVRGEPVHHWIDEEQPDRADRLEVFRQVLDVVVYLHSIPLVHRDLKPANLLVHSTPDGPRAYVVDFGIAFDPARRMTTQGQIMGTPGYTAPEQLYDASMCTDRADIYALGTLLHGLLTGFVDRDADGTLVMEGLDGPHHTLVRDMTMIDPELRPSAAEVQERWDKLHPATRRRTGPTLVATSAAPSSPETWQGTWAPTESSEPADEVVRAAWRMPGRVALAAASLLAAAVLGFGAASASSQVPADDIDVVMPAPPPRAVEVSCVMPEAPTPEPELVEVRVPVPVPVPAAAAAAAEMPPAPSDDRKKLRWPFGRKDK